MIWIDNILAVPAIGIQLFNKVENAIEFQKKVLPFLDSIRTEFSTADIKTQNIWGFFVTTPAGFSFELSPTNIVSQFKYAINPMPQPGTLTIAETPNIKSYSEHFEKVLVFIKDIILLIKDINELQYNRIGIVADINIDENSIPPGLDSWVRYLGNPWENKLNALNINILAILKQEDNYIEQCHHAVDFTVDNVKKGGYKFRLDWQRRYPNPLAFKGKNILNEIDICKKNSFEYFKKFGEGDMNYG